MSKKNSLGLVFGFGALALIGFGLWKKKGTTDSETSTDTYSEADLAINIGDISGPEFTWDRFVGNMQYILDLSLSNKSKNSVGIEHFDLEIFRDNGRVTIVEIWFRAENGIEDRTKEVAFFVPKEKPASSVKITSNTGRTLQLLGIGYDQIVWLGNNGRLPNWGGILNRYVQNIITFFGVKKAVIDSKFDLSLHLLLDNSANTKGIDANSIPIQYIMPAYEMFPNGFKYGVDVTVKVTAYLKVAGTPKITSSKKFTL